jgi:outer membrane protein assembly factor BamB
VIQRQIRFAALACLFATPIASLNAAPPKDWPTFRGADRTAVSKETDLLQQWPADGPPMAWKSEGLGRGYSSIAIADGKIYTLGDGLADAPDKDEYLLCLDQKNGELKWKAKIGAPWNEGPPDWQSSRSTPTVDGDRVYALSAHGTLLCCETASGKELWRKNLKDDFKGNKADGWGYSESVLVDGDQVVCTPGAGTNTMVALDKKTGNVKWHAVREGDIGAGHASIVISNVGSTRVYVQTTGSGALGVRASDGKLLWSYPIDRTTAVIPTPIVRGDLVFFSAGYKRGGALLRQSPADDGVKIDEVYPLNRELANKHGGIVLVGDYLYGDSDDAGMPFCAELQTGKVVWKKRGSGKNSAAFAAADGRLYIHFADGTMVLAKADPEKYEEVGSFKPPHGGERPSWAHPVIADGHLYLRESNSIVCFDVRDKNAGQAAGQ